MNVQVKRKKALDILTVRQVEQLCAEHNIRAKWGNSLFFRKALLENWNDAIAEDVLFYIKRNIFLP